MKTKTTKITGILLTLFMLVSMLGVFAVPAFAADTPEAMWGDSAESLTGSGTLDEAITASPAYIRLQTSITRDSSSVTFNHTGDITLDLNGKTIKSTWTYGSTLLILESGNLTIVDTAGEGKIDASAGGNAAGIGGANSVLKIESGTLIGKNSAVLTSDGTAYLNGGTLQSISNCAVSASYGNVVVVGSKFISEEAMISCYEYEGYDYTIDLSNATGDSYTFRGNSYEASKIARITLPEGWAFFDSNGAIVDIDNTTLAVGAVLTAKSKYVSAPALNIADGGIVLTESESDKYYQQGSNAATPYTGQITITGTSDVNSITVQSGTHDVVISNLTISTAAPFDISAGATVNLYLVGTNTLTATAEGKAGLHVPSGAVLTIDEPDGSTGSLTATGGKYSAGIGSQNNYRTTDLHTGSITINSGEVTAVGGSAAAGIGGAYYCSAADIKICGGTITATGGSDSVAGSGTGIGSGSPEGNSKQTAGILISGGYITATGGEAAAGIGTSGMNGTATITISGGTIIANGGSSAQADIGYGRSSGSTATTIITGGSIKANSIANPVAAQDGAAVSLQTVDIPDGYDISDLYIKDEDNQSYDYGLDDVQAIESKVYLYLPEGVTVSVQCRHAYTNGICGKCGEYQPAEQNTDGYYEIGNAGQLLWFAQQVNSGNTAINGKLTDHIDMTDIEYIPIGTHTNIYKGIFDGNSKTVSGINYSVTSNHDAADSSGSMYAGFFGTIVGAKVKNLAVEGSFTVDYTGTSFNVHLNVGGIVGYAHGQANGVIENCSFVGSVSADGYNIVNAGGIVGCVEYDNQISNCFASASVSASSQYNNGTNADAGAVAGISSPRVTYTNNYYDGTLCANEIGENYASTAAGITSKTPAQFASGEVAYLLGSPWGQTIDSDNYPVLGGAEVYQTGKCSAPTYSNTNSGILHDTDLTAAEHYNANGTCKYCGAQSAAKVIAGDSTTTYYPTVEEAVDAAKQQDGAVVTIYVPDANGGDTHKEATDSDGDGIYETADGDTYIADQNADGIAEKVTDSDADGVYEGENGDFYLPDGSGNITRLTDAEGDGIYEDASGKKYITAAGVEKLKQELEEAVRELEIAISEQVDPVELQEAIDNVQAQINGLGDEYATHTAVAEAINEAKSFLMDEYTRMLDDVIYFLEGQIANKADSTTLTAEINRVMALIEGLDSTFATDTAVSEAIAIAKSEVISSAQSLVDNAKIELQNAINNKADTATLNEKVEALNTAIEAAETVAKAYADTQDAVLKEALEAAIAEANTAIQEANEEIAAIKNNIATIEQQITNITASLDDLKKVDAALEKLIDNLEAEAAELQTQLDANATADAATKKALEDEIVSITTLITALQERAVELEQRYFDLEQYINDEIQYSEEWVASTFATLEQYKAVQTEISAIKGLIEQYKTDVTAEYTAAIVQAITTSEISMKEWVNAVLAEGYYGKAEIDGKITALQTQVAEGDAELRMEIDALETALAKAEAELTAAYEKAIEDAINENNGQISADIAAAVKTAQDNLQAQIDTITGEIEKIKARLDIIEADINSINQQIDAINTSLNNLQNAINSGSTDLSAEIAALNEALANAKAALEAADVTLGNQLVDAIAKAENELASAVSALEDKITEEVSKLQNQINENDTDIDGINASITTINGLIDALKAADVTLGGDITDAVEKAENELKTVQDELKGLIGNVQSNLDDAKAELEKAIADGDADLSTEIANLNTALIEAKAALEKADTDSKAELVKKIEDADKALEDAIKAVQKNLDDAKAELNKAIADGDTGLDGKIAALNDALASAKAALEAADTANKSELITKIDEADADLGAAIDALSNELNNVKNELGNVKSGLESKDAELAKANADNQTFIIIVCVISSLAFCGCGTLAAFYIIEKKKK